MSIEAPLKREGQSVLKAVGAVAAGDKRVASGSGPDVRLKLLQLAESLAQVRVNQEPRQPAVPPAHVPGFLQSKLRALAQRIARRSQRRPRPALDETPGALLLEHAHDTAWAHEHPSLRNVVHVFHQEWHGIRAAAGYLPGRKIALSIHAGLTLRDLERVVVHCLGADAVMFHGWSDNMTLIARALRETAGARPHLVTVWHGNTAQFINPFEVKQVGTLIELHREGLLDRLTSVKPDLHLFAGEFDRELLLNVPPRVRAPSHRQPASLETALIPVPLDWRKNLHTNLFACSAAGLKSVFVTAELGEKLPFELACEVRRLPRPTREELFTLLGNVDVVMNASLSECQPMTALEGLAFRVPCLTGPLALGALDDHPYQRLVQIGAVDAIGALVKGLRAVDEVRRQGQELHDMMVDYEQKLMREAFARYERVIA